MKDWLECPSSIENQIRQRIKAYWVNAIEDVWSELGSQDKLMPIIKKKAREYLEKKIEEILDEMLGENVEELEA